VDAPVNVPPVVDAMQFSPHGVFQWPEGLQQREEPHLDGLAK